MLHRYRGLMMDYSRHFYPVEFIRHTLDAMATSKLNVLHMHITDDESFPMESSSVPALAQRGAFQDRNGNPLTYSAADMRGLQAYVRVLRCVALLRCAVAVSRRQVVTVQDWAEG
jgi:hexosaminidase